MRIVCHMVRRISAGRMRWQNESIGRSVALYAPLSLEGGSAQIRLSEVLISPGVDTSSSFQQSNDACLHLNHMYNVAPIEHPLYGYHACTSS